MSKRSNPALRGALVVLALAFVGAISMASCSGSSSAPPATAQVTISVVGS